MRYDVDLFGVLMPSLLVWCTIAYVLGTLLRRLIERTGFYRFVWHRALFDLALYVCLLGGVVYLSSEILS
ncbi:DUF1656 domain-containing protein [Bradyrhizobium sp. SYSU BS000235]|uniref:DUF1656 domain-containing protein n=1 Tax=Bradyrhizobium sp. SYSU BS000235 TaxID=3411332 RepID=UPI003C71732C